MKIEVIKVTDLIEAINSLPNCPNGFSDVYDKNRILLQIKNTRRYKVDEKAVNHIKEWF